MNITLRAGERIYINGAVLRVDRKATLELMNDATFLLETHVMHANLSCVKCGLIAPNCAGKESPIAAYWSWNLAFQVNAKVDMQIYTGFWIQNWYMPENSVGLASSNACQFARLVAAGSSANAWT